MNIKYSFAIEENKDENSSKDNSLDFITRNINNIFKFENLKGLKKILCIGQVQSGKTKNILEIIKKASEYNYDLIIFLGGTTDILTKQSEKRLNEFKKDYEQKGYFVLSSDYIKSLSRYLLQDKKAIITIMKSDNDLSEIYYSLKKIPLPDKKILIIDDECDYGSINLNKTNTPSKFHKIIYEISQRTFETTLLSFTGTPFGNLLNTQNISEDYLNYKVVVLENSDKYTGLREFNKFDCYYYNFENNDLEPEELNTYINTSIWDTLLINMVSIIQKANDNNIDIFDENFKTQCLINVGSETQKHDKIFDSIINKLTYWSKRPSTIVTDFFNNIIDNYEIKKFSNITTEKFKEFFLPNIKKLINYFLSNVNSIKMLNSKSCKNNFELANHEIIIGGVLLSRGVTFPYLLTELLLNYPKGKIAIDTLLQRCRWFGYRENDYKYMSILMTKELYEAFKVMESYLNLFKPGIMDFDTLKKEVENLDNIYKKRKIGSTSNAKSK